MEARGEGLPRGAAIEFRDVSKAYPQGRRQVAALQGVTLSIRSGEFAAVTGPSGSGKSTLLHLAGGLDLPTGGEVLIGGRSSRGMGDRELTLLRRRTVGFVFQFFHLVPSLTLVENVCLPLLLDGRRMDEVRGRAGDLLRRVGLEARLDHLPEEISGGEMQRAAIARALVADPPILLGDEPTGNLDSAAGAAILDILQEVARERTVVIVTHDEKAAARAGRIIRLRDGRLA